MACCAARCTCAWSSTHFVHLARYCLDAAVILCAGWGCGNRHGVCAPQHVGPLGSSLPALIPFPVCALLQGSSSLQQSLDRVAVVLGASRLCHHGCKIVLFCEFLSDQQPAACLRATLICSNALRNLLHCACRTFSTECLVADCWPEVLFADGLALLIEGCSR